MTTKQIVVLFAVLVLIALVLGLAKESKPVVQVPVVASTTTTVATDLCYYRNEKSQRGLYDRALLQLAINNSVVSGQFRYLPTEKDSKTGVFSGTVSPVNQTTMSRLATVIWNSQAEGMEAKEELFISFGEGSATVAFGEMIQAANGVYMYKDKLKVSYQQEMAQIDCESLDEIVAVEAYVKTADLKTLVNVQPVLGGTLYTTAINANPSTDTVLINYEDGHIAGSGTATYTYDTSGIITITGFTKSK